MAALGPTGVGLLVAIENIFPPIPSEVVLPFAGFVAARGDGGVWAMVIAATLGSVGGAVVLYELGARVGQHRMRSLLCRMPLTDADDVDRAIAWFDHHGDLAVFTGRFLPVVRSLVSLPAGAAAMPRTRFILLSTVGTALWNTVWVWGGYLLGSRWHEVSRYADWFNTAALVGLALAVARFVWRRRDRARGTS